MFPKGIRYLRRVCISGLAVILLLVAIVALNRYRLYVSIHSACSQVARLNPSVNLLPVLPESEYLRGRSGIFIHSPLGDPHWCGLFPGEYIYAICITDGYGVSASPVSVGNCFEILGGSVVNCEHLDLSSTGASDNVLVHFKDSALRSLRLSGTRVSDRGVLYCLTSISRLESIDVSQTKVGDSGLAPLLGSSSILSLQLNGSRVGDLSAPLLCSLPNIVELDIGNSQFTDIGVGKCSSIRSLKHMYVAELGVSDSVLPALSKLTKLITLDVSSNPVSASGLSEFARCHLLEVLWATNTQVDSASVGTLQDAMPHTRIMSSEFSTGSGQTPK